MDRLLSTIRGFVMRALKPFRRRSAGPERVIPSEPRTTHGRDEDRTTMPTGISSAGYSDVHQRPEGEAATATERAEVSSLQGPHPIAPSMEEAGHVLADTGAVEVPVGHTSDTSYDFELDHGKLPQPDTTGTSLQQHQEHEFGMLEDFEAEHITARSYPQRELTAQPKRASERALDPFEDEHYDTVDPEDLGQTFLSRATEDRFLGVHDGIGDDDLEEGEVDRGDLSGGIVPQMVSEASRSSAMLGDEEIGELEEMDEDLRRVLPMDVRNRIVKAKKVRTRQRPSQI